MIVSENNFFTFNSPPGPFEHESFDSFSLVAKGVWHDKLGGNWPPIWMNTIMSKVSKKIGCQEKFYM